MEASPPTAAPDRLGAPHRLREPDRLREQVLADWAPIAPLASPWRRAIRLTPVAALMAGIAAVYWGPQPDWGGPGFGVTIGLSVLQWIAGVAIVGLALREAVPGRATGRAAGVAILGGVIVLLALNLAAKDAVAAAIVPSGLEWRFWAICLRGPVLLAAPVLVLASLLASRAFPVRPAWTGALGGLGAGVLIDAGWRLGCFVTDASHVAGAHWLAIAASGAIGSAVVWLGDRIRWRR